MREVLERREGNGWEVGWEKGGEGKEGRGEEKRFKYGRWGGRKEEKGRGRKEEKERERGVRNENKGGKGKKEGRGEKEKEEESSGTERR